MSDAGADISTRLQSVLQQYAQALSAAAGQACPYWLGISRADFEQEIRIRLWRALSRRDDLQPNAAFIFRVATTAAIDLVRRRKAQGDAVPIDEQMMVAEGQVLEDSALQALEDCRRHRALESALARLDSRRETVLRLYLQGFSLVEIADLAELSQAAARNLLYRGADELKRLIRDDDP